MDPQVEMSTSSVLTLPSNLTMHDSESATDSI